MAKKTKILSFYFKVNLLNRILIALVLGIALGIALPQNSVDVIGFLTPFGDLFIRLLKMIIVPIITCSLIVGTSSISPAKLGKVGIKAIFFYFLTTLCAIIIGLACAFVFAPGVGLDLSDTSVAISKTSNAPSISQIFLNMVPTNPFESMAKAEILPIITFCMFFGIGLAFCKDSDDERVKSVANTVYNFFDGMSEIMFKVIKWVMEYAPIGVFALMFVVFNKNGASAVGPLLNVTLSVYIGLILQILLVYCVVCLIIGISPLEFLKKARPPMLTAFVTRSSNGTLPVSMETVDQDMGVPRSIYGFVLPVGATVNMNGTTIYLGVCAIFISNACGIDLGIGSYITIIITSILAAIGTAGVPGAGALMLLLVLESVGIKVEGSVGIAYGMILAMDAILDMGRTSMNVTGDIMASVWVAKTENELDITKWEKKI